MLVNQALKFIDQGKAGHNKGIPFTINKLNHYIKIWKGRYYLYFALSGVGKSKFVYDQHIFNVLDEQIQHNVLDEMMMHIYSLEISPVTLIGNIMIQYLQKYKNIITDSNQIFSFEDTIDETLYKHLHSNEMKEYLLEAEKYMKIYTRLEFNDLIKNTNNQLNLMGDLTMEKGYVKSFIPKSEDYLFQIIIDHISLTQIIPRKTRYESIGIISRYLFAMRNKGFITPVVIQQVNPDRSRKPEETVSPNHEDLRDNKETYNDSDIAVAIGNPFKHGMPTYNGYQIFPGVHNPNGLQDRFRIVDIRKNRYGGGENRIIPTLFVGETSHYKDIKRPLELTKEEYLLISNIKKTYKNKTHGESH